MTCRVSVILRGCWIRRWVLPWDGSHSPPGNRYATHAHPTHQLVWAQRGVLTVGVGDTVWVLSPSRALFIPADLPHTTAAATATELHSLYLRPVR